jgi:hypothetical protein
MRAGLMAGVLFLRRFFPALCVEGNEATFAAKAGRCDSDLMARLKPGPERLVNESD